MLTYYQTFNYDKDITTRMHSHLQQQWVYVHGGLGIVRAEQQSIFVSHGQLLKIPARFEHEFEVMQKGRVSVFYAELDDGAQELTHQSINPLLVQLLEIFQSELDQATRDAYAQVIFHQLLGQHNIPTASYTSSRLDKRLLMAMDLISAEPNVQLSLAKVAKQANVSERSLHRLFLQGLGCSFRQWRTHSVMQKALTLQKQGLSQTQIAFELGYASLSAFSTALSNYHKTNLTPA